MTDPVIARLAAAFGADGSASRWSSPGELAVALDPTTVQTPALELIDQALVDVDAGRCDRLIVSMPPQEGKSERVSHYGALWLLLRDPRRRLGLVSYEAGVAQRMSYLVRNDLETFTGGEGGVDLGLRLRADSKAVSHWRFDGHRGGVYAIGMSGALTSVPLDALIIDDPVKDARAADSEVVSESAWAWWQAVARPRLAPGAPVIVVQTRWSESDLAGRLIAKAEADAAAGVEFFDRWRVVNVPAQADHRPERGEVDALGREPGEFMVSARGRTREQWEATRAATSPRLWSALYQGRPSPDAGTLLMRAHWQRFDLAAVVERAADGSMRCPGADMVVQSWDMAFKDTKASDFVVGQVWARFGNQAFLIDQVRARMSFTATVAAVEALSRKWPQALAKLVEDKANGTAVIDQLRLKISGLIPVSPGQDSKLTRATAISPYVEAGQVHVPSERSAAWAEAFVDEAATFPNGKHDDQVDAATYAIGRLLSRSSVPISVAVPNRATFARIGVRMSPPAGAVVAPVPGRGGSASSGLSWLRPPR